MHKGWWRVNNFYEVLQPFNCIARLFGFYSIAIIEDQPNSMAKSKYFRVQLAKYCIILFWVIFFVSSLGINTMNNFFEHFSNNEIANIGRRWLMFISLISAFCGTLLINLMYKRSQKIVLSVIEIDSELRRLGSPVDLIAQSKTMIFYILFKVFMCTITITVSANYVDFCDQPIHCVYMHWPVYTVNCMYMVFISHFIVFGYAVLRRFQIFNSGFW